MSKRKIHKIYFFIIILIGVSAAILINIYPFGFFSKKNSDISQSISGGQLPETDFHNFEKKLLIQTNKLPGIVQSLPLIDLSWSHKGDKIVFTKNWDIWVADSDGKNARNITNTPDKGEKSQQWSPDDTKIVFESWTFVYDPKDGFEIETMDPNGNNRKLLVKEGQRLGEVANVNTLYLNPLWTPDGERILFLAFGSEKNEHLIGSARSQIWVIDKDGKNPTWLSEASGKYIENPQFNPDGDEISFELYPDGEVGIGYAEYEAARPPFDLWAMDTYAEEAPEALVKGKCQFAELNCGIVKTVYKSSWSPDGKHIIFTSKDSMWIVDSNGANLKKIIDGNQSIDGDTLQYIDNPIWNPNSKEIAFNDARGNLWVIGSDGTNAIKIAGNAILYPNTHNPNIFAWSPDGIKIIFAEKDNSNIWLIEFKSNAKF